MLQVQLLLQCKNILTKLFVFTHISSPISFAYKRDSIQDHVKVMEVAVGVVIGVFISVLMSFLALYLTKRLGMEEQRLLHDIRQENRNNILLTEMAKQLRTLQDTATAAVPPRSRAQ